MNSLLKIPTEDQFVGCVVGQSLGDAIGFPVEGASQASCQDYIQQVIYSEKIFEQRRGPFLFGQYSDDSQLARELLLSYLEMGDFNPQNYAEKIAALFAQNTIVGRGMATQRAAYRLIQGIPWKQAGTPPPDAGNGSAMRAGPVGLLFWNNPKGLIQTAHDQGRITHTDPRCSAGSVAIAGAVAIVLQQDFLNVQQLLQQLSTWTHPYDPIIASAFVSMENWMSLPPEEAFVRIATIGISPEYLPSSPMITPFVTTSVLWSIYSFLHTPYDYLNAISTAISAGGDVDTTAAMTGAISGARLGLNNIPTKLAERLNDQGSWGYRDLIDLAKKIYNRVIGVGK